jgi:hypothetical protein
VESQEGLGEARGESGLGLGDTLLGTGHLGGVTGDEVVHGLGGGELGDGREDTTGVACEEDDVLGVAVGDARDLGVLDVLDGVCAAGVLGEGGVIVVDDTGFGVEDDVLKDGTELDGVVNIGLLLGGETNALGVATTLDVEDTSVTPAVLVVTDQGTLGVGGESGLASSGETEEDGYVAVLALVGGRVEGEDVVLDGHLVVEDSEDTWLIVSIDRRNVPLLPGLVLLQSQTAQEKLLTAGESASNPGKDNVEHVEGIPYPSSSLPRTQYQE